MSEVSTTEAKKHLSELLRRVEAGEMITITRYGKPVATIAPLMIAKQPAPDMSDFRTKYGKVRGSAIEVLLQMRDEERY